MNHDRVNYFKGPAKFEGNKLALIFSAIWIVNDALKL